MQPQLNLPVFPIAPGSKGPPLLKDWPNRAHPDFPIATDQNYGVHATGLCIVDVDLRGGGHKTYEELGLFEGWPDTTTIQTPSGGRHHYYRMPAGMQARNSAGLLGPGIDTKGHAGYVVGPGSKTARGEYVVERAIPMAEAPQWLIDRVVSTERHQAEHVDVPDADEETVTRAGDWLSTRPKGEGAYATACGLRDIGVSLEQAQALMAEHDPRPNVPAKVEHAYTYAQNEPGTAISKPEDFELIEEPPTPAATAAPSSARRLLDFGREAQQSAGYVIKGTLSRKSYAMIYGQPGAGKTFVALDMAYHVAAGREWHGRKVKAGGVLYLAYEGMGGMGKRARALLQHYGTQDVPLYIQPASHDLRTGEGRRALAKDIAALPEVPSLIVFDTFAHALMGGDENSAQDVGAFNTGVAALIARTGACVLILHHPKKTGESARGSGALLGAVDTEIHVADHAIKPTKQRDVELGEPIGFALKPITVGIDEDNDAITSCVVVPAQITADTATVSKLKGSTKLAWDVLCTLRPTNAPITDVEWKEGCTEFISTRRQAWYEVRVKLQRYKLIVVGADGFITRRME